MTVRIEMEEREKKKSTKDSKVHVHGLSNKNERKIQHNAIGKGKSMWILDMQ